MNVVSGDQQAKPADATTAIPVSQPTRAENIRKSVEKWFFWRGFTFAGWFWLFAAIVDKLFGTEFPAPAWLVALPAVTLVYLFSTSKPWSLGYLPYGLFFPFVMLFLAVRAMPNLSRYCSKALRPATGFAAALVCLLVLFFDWSILLLCDNQIVLMICILIHVFANLLVLAAGVRWASDPLYPFLNILTLVDWFQRKIDSSPVQHATDPAQALKQAQNDLQAAGYYEMAFTWLQGKLDGLTKRTIVPLFTLILVILFSINVIGYGISIFVSQRLEPTAFQGKPGVVQSCVWSLSIMMTAPLPEIMPVSWVGYMLFGMQLVSTFFLITVFFAMFSAAMGIHGRHRIEELTEISNKAKTWIERKRNQALAAVAAALPLAATSATVQPPPPQPPLPGPSPPQAGTQEQVSSGKPS